MALQWMPKSWPIFESTLLTHVNPGVSVHNREELLLLDSQIYHTAFTHIRKNLELKRRQINWGGDHSVALASIAAFIKAFPNGKVLWIDAHADLNTPESSLSGNFHGMPLSILLGLGRPPRGPLAEFWQILKPDQIIYFGLRDLDPFEIKTIKKLGILSYSASALRAANIEKQVNQLLEQIADYPLHVSFDIDSIDPREAPATGVKVANGLSKSLVLELAARISDLDTLKSVDVVEINPLLSSVFDAQRTYQVAFALIARLFKFKEDHQHVRNLDPFKAKLPITNPWPTPLHP
jgi:arginase